MKCNNLEILCAVWDPLQALVRIRAGYVMCDVAGKGFIDGQMARKIFEIVLCYFRN